MDRLRVVLTIALGMILAVWMYGDLATVEFWKDETFGFLWEEPYELVVVGILVVAGFAVRRFWVLAALAVPALALGYAQLQGERGSDGVEPLLSPPGIATLVWFALFLLIGVGLAKAWERWHELVGP